VSRSLALLAGVVLGGAPLAAQDASSIARRVAAAPDGEVRLAYAARAGVVGDGWSIIAWRCDSGGRCQRQHFRGDFDRGIEDWRNWSMQPGPVRVSLTVRDRAVTAARVYVGGAWPPDPAALDLGTVPAAAAASYLLGVARREGERARPPRDVMFAATLADSVVIWRELLALARDRSLGTAARKQAIHWLGQEAEMAILPELDALVSRDDEEIELREAAVFALSQRPAGEGIPLLLRVARDHRDHRLRRRAMFWLAQSGDPRALDLFEEILTRR
jgi:hypothetical protein